MMNGIKRTAVIFSIIFICLVLFASCLIVAEYGHNCIGEDCQICTVVDAAQKLLQGAKVFAIATALYFVAKFYLSYILLFIKKYLYSSLISLKVKLSN